ncbi:MAG: GIY-YIG nuclease family protein [Candidatus Uhrbacteria bacterium]|nr:GIY-YIG nuclease family protein [Candidatus Uhrbacteria bacterium]
MEPWIVYMVRCSDGTLYTGITKNLEQRVAKHNDGTGAKYTRSRLPVELVWHEVAMAESDARKREAEIKKWKRNDKFAFLKKPSDAKG